MTAQPPLLPTQVQQDNSHLNLLAVFHFVGCALGFVAIGFLALHFVFMRSFFENPEMWTSSNQPPPPPVFFALFRWFYVLGAIWFLASAVLNLISGFCLRKRKARVFSLVVAGVNCMHMPLGTVLGVFTLIVLLRESVQQRYLQSREA